MTSTPWNEKFQGGGGPEARLPSMGAGEEGVDIFSNYTF